MLIVLFREDSDDDDIEKGDHKMPRYAPYFCNHDFLFSLSLRL